MALFVLIVIYYAISDLNIQIYMLNVIEPVKRENKRNKYPCNNCLIILLYTQ